MKNCLPLMVALLVVATVCRGFEPYDYKSVPFPDDAENISYRLVGLVEILTDLASGEELPAANRAKILAAARRISPLNRRTFYTEYQLKTGQKPTEAMPIPLESIQAFLAPHIKMVEAIPDTDEFLDFLEEAIDFEASDAPPPIAPSADPFATEKVKAAKPASASNQCGFLSLEGCVPIGCYNEIIGGTAFQFSPGDLKTKVFLSAYRESLKFIALSGTQGLEGRRIDFTVVGSVDDSDGPAGALPCAVLTRAVSENFKIASNIAFAGDVNADGTVQPLDDIGERLKSNPDDLHDVVVIPKGDRYATNDILLLEGADIFTKTQMIEVSSLSEAVEIAKVDRNSNLTEALNTFAQVQQVLNAPGGKKYLTNSHVKKRLARVLELAPNHVSAWQLNQAALRRLPGRLSLNGSIDLIFEALDPVLEDGKIDAYSRLDPMGFKRLQKYRKHLDPTVQKLADAAITFETSGRVGSNTSNERARVKQNLKEQLNAISRDVKFREKMM